MRSVFCWDYPPGVTGNEPYFDDDEDWCKECYGEGLLKSMQDCQRCNGTGIEPKKEPDEDGEVN